MSADTLIESIPLAPRSGPRAAWRDSLATLAADQDDLVTSAQLRSIGVPSSTVSGRTRAGGLWTRVLPGVHLVSGGRPDRVQRERAALLYAAPHGILTGATVLRRLGVRAGRLQEVSANRDTPELVHLLVPHEHHLTAAGFLEVSRTRRWPQEQTVDGLRMASTSRAIADTARRSHSTREVAALVDECVRTGLTSLEELKAELDEGPRQGSAHLRAVLRTRAETSRAGLDALAHDLVRTAGLTEAIWRPMIVAPGGHVVGRPLAWVDAAGLVLDIAGPDSGSVARHQRFATFGITVFPVSAHLLQADPVGQAHVLAETARHSARRPRPAVTAVPIGDG